MPKTAGSSNSGDGHEPEFYVVLSETDNTYNTVPASDIVQADLGIVEVGDVVNFYWNKARHEGPVHFVGDDFGLCNKVATQLTNQMKNTLRRSSSSFYEGKPRKSKLKGIAKLSNSNRKESVTTPTEKEKKRKKILSERREKRETDEAVQLLSEIAAAEDSSELNSTLEMSHSNSASGDESATNTEDESPKCKRNKRNDDTITMELEKRVRELTAQLAAKTSEPKMPKTPSHKTSGHSQPNSNKENVPKERGKPPSTPQSSSKRYSILMARGAKPFVGETLLFSSSSEDTAELLGFEDKPLGVFCDSLTYQMAGHSNTATGVARRLLRGVFTNDAIKSCSITGLPPRGKGREAYADPSNIRPHLCPKAVRAIIDQATEWQRTKYLRPKKDAREIRNAMSIYLCSLRKENLDTIATAF